MVTGWSEVLTMRRLYEIEQLSIPDSSEIHIQYIFP